MGWFGVQLGLRSGGGAGGSEWSAAGGEELGCGRWFGVQLGMRTGGGVGGSECSWG